MQDDAVVRLLEQHRLTQLKPLLQREQLMDLPLLRSMGAAQLVQSLGELGVEARSAHRERRQDRDHRSGAHRMDAPCHAVDADQRFC